MTTAADAIHRPRLDLARYDRSPALSPDERTALRRLRRRHWGGRTVDAIVHVDDALQRLVLPIEDALAHLDAPDMFKGHALLSLLRLCDAQRSAFWSWDAATWSRLLSSSRVNPAARPCVLAAAYELGCLPDLTAITAQVEWTTLARKVLGRRNVDTATSKVDAVLAAWGYRQHTLIAVRAGGCPVARRS